MMYQKDISRDKSPSELGIEACWFVTHTTIAFLMLVGVLGVMSLNHPDPDSSAPKMLGTILAFLVPMAGGFLFARKHRSNRFPAYWIRTSGRGARARFLLGVGRLDYHQNLG